MNDEKILKLLNENARYTEKELAVMLGASEEEVKNRLVALAQQGIIRGFKPIIDWERVDERCERCVTALIELKVTPQRNVGFEDIAAEIIRFDEVETVYLMSGGFDLTVVVRGKTFQEVALFVAKRLATIESVTSTATHFVLSRYKEMGIRLNGHEPDDRGKMSF